MSIQLVFYRNGWLKEGRATDHQKPKPKPLSIEKSLAELDTLLSQEDEIKECTAAQSVEGDELSSTESQKGNKSPVEATTENNGSPSRICLKGHLDNFIESPECAGSADSPGRRSDNDDAKFVSSNMIHSKDSNDHSHAVSASIDEVGTEEVLASRRSYSSPRTRRSTRSKSTSSSKRKKRGDSLERDISRTILQLASDSSQFAASDQNQSKSVMDILKDLLATPLPLSFFGRESAETAAAPEQQELSASKSEQSCKLRNKSIADEEDYADAEVSTEDRKHYLQDSSVEAHNSTETLRTTQSSCTSYSTSYLSQPGQLSYSSESLAAPSRVGSSDLLVEAPIGNEESVQYESESIVALSGKPDRAVTKIKLFAQSLEASFHQTLIDLCIPEESESEIVESYATGGMIATAPLLGVYQDAPKSRAASSPNEIVESLDEDPDSSCVSPFKADTTIVTADTSCHTSSMGDSFAIEQYNEDDDDWTTFGESVFSDSFSPDKRSSPTPTQYTEPDSPTSVFKMVAESDLKMTTIPDEGHEWQQMFPHLYSADSLGVEWEEYDRRFAI